MVTAGSPNRRGLIAVGASALVAGAFARTAPVHAMQTDRQLLDLLLGQEQIQVVYYSTVLDTFDDAAIFRRKSSQRHPRWHRKHSGS